MKMTKEEYKICSEVKPLCLLNGICTWNTYGFGFFSRGKTIEDVKKIISNK